MAILHQGGYLDCETCPERIARPDEFSLGTTYGR